VIPAQAGKLKQASAIALFAITIATVAVTWRQDFWATALPEVSVFALAAVWLIAGIVNAERLQSGFVLIPVVAAVLWPLLQLAVGATVYRWATSLAVLYWAANAAVVFVGLQIFSEPAIRRWYLRVLVIAGFLISVAAPLQKFTAEGKIFWLFPTLYPATVMGPFVYENHYAAFIELLLPIALTSVFSDRSGWRTLHGLAAVVMYASVFASSSRTGFVLTTLEVLVVPMLAAKRAGIGWRQLALSAAIFLGMLGVLALAVGPESLFLRLQQKNPYGGRREYTESSLRMIRDKPVLGVGMGNWSTAYPAYATFDEGYFANEAHNDWAQWAVEGGLPFALLMFSIAVWSFPRALRTGWGTGVTVVFLQCFVDFPIRPMGVAIVFFSLIAALAAPDGRTQN
jgi:O-antigen ligase